MHPTHDFVLSYVRDNFRTSACILDYGCGAGEIVKASRHEGFDTYGADIFYDGVNRKKKVEKLGYLGTIVREIKEDHVDFQDNHFDVIVCNQVLEHVEDFDAVLSEMRRLLKPGGTLLCLFPSREVWREGHCGVPFLHRFPKGSRPRIYYAFVWRLFGFGYHKGGKTRLQWSSNFCEWLDKYTHYRPFRTICERLTHYFDTLEFKEVDYLGYRLERAQSRFRWLFRAMKHSRGTHKLMTTFVRKRGGLMFVATKNGEHAT